MTKKKASNTNQLKLNFNTKKESTSIKIQKAGKVISLNNNRSNIYESIINRLTR